ncbi:amidohydrolase family protein [Candidatus Neptunochlamydia vexilliferae]|uniref:Amidohydrolase-related domain-containing protein n=1 Tax=Candidatus Neptunichlamydia vexilliferae TaxID=1651774 RepID=A0ABS0B0B9_9BACT|nr:amidohydrolase family protein [Candidatus Neptunochlamydia vexilliferae]MBF5059837.1 hypothetical protein [Candidatus Neptunochlamydia vexilliferae]
MSKVYEGEIIDGHMHLWDLSRGEYPWLQGADNHFEDIIGDYKKMKRNFFLPEYQEWIKPHHVTKSVHIETNAAPTKGLHETEWLQKIADEKGFPHGIVAYADLSDPDIENVTKEQCQFPNVRGIRQILFEREGEPSLLNAPHCQKGLKYLASQNLTFDIAIFGKQIKDAAKVVKEYDDVLFILDHLGWPLDVTDSGFTKWKEDLASLATCPNCYLKLSGIGLVFQRLDQENIKRFLHAGIELFGEDRCLFGSNVPPAALFISYAELIGMFKEAFSTFDIKVQHKLFYENAKEFYGI